jgi:hypothetical protein
LFQDCFTHTYKLTSKVHNYRTKINENKEIKDIQ